MKAADRKSVDSTIVAEDNVRRIGEARISPSSRAAIPQRSPAPGSLQIEDSVPAPRRRRILALSKLSGMPR